MNSILILNLDLINILGMFRTNTTDCSLWPGEEHRCFVIYVLSKLTAALSIIGCAFVMMLIIILRKYKLFVQKMIFTLAMSAFLESVCYISNDDIQVPSDACRFRGFFCHFFGWATMLWVLMITVNMLLTIKKRSSSQYLKWFHVFVWVVSFIVSLIPFSKDSYGPAGIWCWIQKDYPALRFGTWYIPLFVIGISMLIIYLYIICSVLRETRPVGATLTEEEVRDNMRYREELRPLLSYPLIYIIFTIPGLMYRIDDAAHPKEPPNYSLVILSVIFLQSIGLFNSLSFIIFHTTIKDISISIVKQHIISLFSGKAHVVHQNYEVEDLPITGSRDIPEITETNVHSGVIDNNGQINTVYSPI